MTEPDRTIIGGSKTCGDWRAFRRSLVPGGGQVAWHAAYADFFLPRIRFRYLDPIGVLQKYDTQQGEGFSIVAIHCTLVEFLESTVRGINYRFAQRDADLGPHEYRFSGPVFVSFLTEREPFKQCFTTKTSGQEFYQSVRCGLLHEARTKGGWKIWADGNSIADVPSRTLFRNNFHDALLQFVEWYRGALRSDVLIQQAFVRKFDDLCV